MNNITRKAGAAFGLAAIAGFSVAFPASAAVTASEWGLWATYNVDHDYTIEFENSSMPDATVDVYDADSYDIYSPSDESEGFTSADPLGALVGPNQDSSEYMFMKIETAGDVITATRVEIDFPTPIPAGQLVLAISDIDSDNARITAQDADGNDLTGAEIVGSASPTAFNWDDISNTGDVPVVTAESNYVTMGDAPDNTDGSTGWIRPSTTVSHITIETLNEDTNNTSTERFWVGQVIESAPAAELGHTGVDKSTYLAAIAGGAILAAGGFIGLRRRRDV